MAVRPSNNLITAYTQEQVERLTGVSRRQLRAWATGDQFFAPGFQFADGTRPTLRLHYFLDLVGLKVVNALRNEAKVPFPELKRVKQKLSHLGEDLWSKTTLCVVGKRVVFVGPETGEKEEISGGQRVLRIPLQVIAARMEDAARAMRQRKPDAIGKIEQRRGVAQNRPVIAGTRIPVSAIQEFHRASYSVDAISKQYPTLAHDDIRAAIAHEDVA
jgi:uncharacterized protein (DUF433 family)